MTVRDEKRGWVVALLGTLLTVGVVVVAALGFKSPNSRIGAVEDRVSKIEPVVSQNTTDIAVVKSRMDDFTDGMNRLLDSQGLARIPKR